MVESEFTKLSDEVVEIKSYSAKTEKRSKLELETMKLRTEAELVEIDKALEVFK